MVYLLKSVPTEAQVTDMLSVYVDFIKLAVDIKRGILAGGGEMHADCEEALLEDGSKQQNVWGADWHPASRKVTFVSMINIRPSDGNSSTTLRDPELRAKVEKVVRSVFESQQ